MLSSVPVALIGFFVREITTTLNIYTASFYRLIIATIALGIILPFFDKNTYNPNKKQLPMYAITGLAMAVNLILFNVANSMAPIANVYLLASISPAVVILLSVLYLKEKINQAKIFALLLAFIGLGIMNPLQSANMLGNALSLLSGITFAIFFTLMKKCDTGTGAGVTLWYFIFATIFSTPLLFFGHTGIISAIPWIVGFAIISTTLTYIATTLLLEHESAGTTSILQTIIIPLCAIIVAYFAFAEIPSVRTLIGGGVLVLGGVALELPNLYKKKDARSKKKLRGKK